MNIIDRSPLKTSAQEALLAQSARRISEAKTAEEKASVVQNFAEQMRLEKLRAKRLQENMRELNHAISNGAPSVVSVVRYPPPPAVSAVSHSNFKLNASNPNNVADARIAMMGQENRNQRGSPPTWANPNAGQFDLFRNGAGNINALGNAIKPDAQQSGSFAGAGPGPMNIGLGTSSHYFPKTTPFPDVTKPAPSLNMPNGTSPLSRPLNVNAAPFTMQPMPLAQPTINTVTSQQQRLASSNAMKGVLIRRMTASPPIPSPVVAVAPKTTMMGVGRESRAIVSTTEGRPRSASIGSRQALTSDQQQQVPGQSDVVSMSGMGRGGGVVYYQQHRLTSPLFSRAPFAQLNRDSDMPKPQQQLDDASKPKPRMGSVKIDNTATGGASLLQSEDWDLEYAEPKKQQRPKQTTPNVEQAAGFVPPVASENKDWLAVLKERDDMGKRRYSRDVMLRLYQSEASKIRPSHLSPEYNSDVGLWSPDLWFFINFQKDQQQAPVPSSRSFGRGGAMSSGQQNPQSAMAGLRRINCLSTLQQKQVQERSMSSD